MWRRADLKAKGKATFKANYWKSVLVALIIAVVVGGGMSVGIHGPVSGSPLALPGMGMMAPSATSTDSSASDADDFDEFTSETGDYDEFWQDLADEAPSGSGTFSLGQDGFDIAADDGSSVHLGSDGSVDITGPNGGSAHLDGSGLSSDQGGDATSTLDGIFESLAPGALAALGISVFLVLLVALALAFALDAFLCNPIEIGCRRFFLTNLNRKAEVKEVAFGFDHDYLNGVKTMFFRDLFIFLWSLLFIIPGIVKSYEYRMIPYLIAENPQMTREEAFATSKQLMSGNKWKAFMLDLSFIGWAILSVLTLGILAIFYVSPYKAGTDAALYEALRYGNGTAQPAGQHSAPGNGQPQAPDMTDQPAWATGADSAITEDEPVNAAPVETVEIPQPASTGDTPQPPATESPEATVELPATNDDELPTPPQE